MDVLRGKGWRRERSRADGLADPAHGGRFQALRRRARPGRRKSHRVRGTHSRHSRRERRRQVHPDQDPVRRRRAGLGSHRARRRGSRLRFPRRRQSRRHCLHLPGAFARSRAFGRRQHRHLQSAAPFRDDRPARAASPRRGGARASRSARNPSDGAGQGLGPIAPADGRDRQGAGAQAARPHSRRGDVGVDRSRCRQGIRRPQALAPGRAGAPLHFPPHA